MSAPLSPTRLSLIRAAVELNPGTNLEDAYADRAALLAEVDRLNAQTPTRDELLAALTELVECKDLKDRLEAYEASSTDELVAMDMEYGLRQPRAWDVARALVAKSKPSPPPPVPKVYCEHEDCILEKGHEGGHCDLPF